MSSRAAENGHSLGAAAREVSDRAVSLARLEVQLAKLEVVRKLGSLAKAAGFAAASAVLVLFGLGFGLAAVAAGLAEAFPMWLSLLIVFGGLTLVAAALGAAALRAVKRASPPVPKEAIDEAKETRRALQEANGR
jgi:membrane protein implicated in regulation of membrane protease activity